MFSSICLVAGAIPVAGLVFPVTGQTAGDEIRITEQYPPAELRFQAQRFVAVHRKPVPQPGVDDQWVVVRDRNWVEKFRAYPGRDLAQSVVFRLFEAQRAGRDSSGGPDSTGQGVSGFMVQSAALREEVLAVSGSAWLLSGESVPVSALYSLREGRLIRAVNTFSVQCWSIEFDTGGDLWCLGSNLVSLRRKSTDYDMLYRYSPTLKLVSSGIQRSSVPEGRAPEADAAKGASRIFFTRSGMTLVLVPSVDLLLAAGKDVKELRWWQLERFGRDMIYTLAVGGTGRLLALLPENAEGGVRVRYRVFELSAEVDGGDRRRLLDAAELPAKVRWVLADEAGRRDFAGRSTELVGMDGAHPVIWDRSAGKVEWLEKVE